MLCMFVCVREGARNVNITLSESVVVKGTSPFSLIKIENNFLEYMYYMLSL